MFNFSDSYAVFDILPASNSFLSIASFFVDTSSANFNSSSTDFFLYLVKQGTNQVHLYFVVSLYQLRLV
jgi:hypothetical protein